jgi:phosphate transport system substrate-binding protein
MRLLLRFQRGYRVKSAAKVAICCAFLLGFAACSGQGAAGSGEQLTGAGSTFDNPFFSKAFYQYSQQHPNVTINYQSIGSGGGIQQFTQKTIDFGATDVPMNASELARAKDKIVQIPVALGGETISYNLPGVTTPLRLTGSVLADIFLGKIGNWSDPALAKLNPGVKLPKMAIVVAHRSDGSGTTFIFTDYLSSVSPQWKSTVGAAKSVQWPAKNSVGGKGNEGVAGLITQTPGAIGYVELAYAIENHMSGALLQNSAGKFLADTQQTVAAAAASKPGVTATNFSIVNRPGASSYPIAGYSWVLVYAKQTDAQKSKALKDVLTWLTGPQGQSVAGSLQYVPLPSNIQALARKALAGVHM